MIRWNSGEHSTNPDWPTCFEWKGGQNFIDEIGWLLALVDEQQKTITELREILNED